MSIASTTSKSGPYACNGATTVFAVGFACLAAADLLVVRTDASLADAALVLNTDYSVALNADQTNSPGGTVTLFAAPAAGYQVTILRNIALTQGTSLPNQGGWYPKVVENAFDKLTMIVQQLSEKVSRSVQVGVTIADPNALIATIAANVTGAAASASSAAASATAAGNSAAAAGESASVAASRATDSSTSAASSAASAALALKYANSRGGGIVRSPRSANTMLGTADVGTLIDITSGTFTQTFDTPANLGDGWYVYLRNSGTGDITVQNIDGVASFVMFPGECRLVQNDGAALRSVVLQGYYKVFTASATYVKPPGYKAHEGVLWSAGASGDFGGSAGQAAKGGFGGGAFPFTFADSVVPVTVTVTIGAGGAGVTSGAGQPGGDSSFGSLLTVKGATASSGGAVARPDGTALANPSNTALGAFGFEAGTTATGNCNNTVWGGAGAVQTPATSGSSIWGGAAGASMNSAVATTAGTSKFGGNGGATGQAGAAPAGGGGAASAGTTGAGARGELRIQGVV